MKIVVATGVFDILHPGHVLFLEEAKKLGDRLIVIVARDKTVEERKNNLAIPEKQRLDVVKALKPVDKALLGDEEDIFRPIREIDPDIIALGRDQHFDEEKLEKELKKRGLKARVVRIERYLEGGLNSSRRIIEKIREC
ncbi:MAG TPA: FAD synthase [Candidatus Altiarchaeales archaeon]|mgnify:CR=1 FL=1|nr:FAD synthase [Candidatus Altiarchaeales archaeon]